MTIEKKFREWTGESGLTGALINVFHRIREIPYAVIPELNDPERYADILNLNKGSCTPKHLLLCNMYQRLGLFVLYAVYPFRWDQIEIDYPPRLRRLAREVPESHHLACRVEIGGDLLLVDATLDTGMKALGLPVNEDWAGAGDTRLPIAPCGEEQLYYPSEAGLMQASYDDKSIEFYRELNEWLDNARRFSP